MSSVAYLSDLALDLSDIVSAELDLSDVALAKSEAQEETRPPQTTAHYILDYPIEL